jgi:Mor family transcriptional regulator
LTAEFKEGKGTVPTPVGVTGLHSLEAAIQTILTRLYAGFSFPAQPIARKSPKKTERNAQIRKRFAAGEGISDLGREFGLTPQRVYQIVHRRRK